MGDPTDEPQQEAPTPPPGNRGPTPARLVVWIIVGGFALFLIVTGIVGILTKAR
jgi:hypothetical protein